MCGRIAQSEPSDFARRLEALFDTDSGWRPSWNIGPMAQILGVRETDDGRRMGRFRWGLVPGWAKDPASGARCFNARGETVATKPTFRSAFKHRRLLVPVDGFYEWQSVADAPRKTPTFFTRADGDVLVLAGLWEYWKADDREILSATVITTAAGPDLEGIHDRQPVVLEPDHWERWLDPGLEDRDELEAMLSASPGTLRHWVVGQDVGNIRNDGPQLVEQVAG
jgi:putative SOS response-associated peptidase YedK